MVQRVVPVWMLVFGAIGCVDWIAPVEDSARLCIADSDCEGTFFCLNGRCLKSSAPRCGDGVLHADEQCDDGNRDSSDACVACRTARCGDGAVHLGVESCDEGDGMNADDQADRCRTDCRLARCGDGTTDSNEACDEGVANSVEVPDRCRIDCTLPSCGDGVVDSGEDCDDANAIATDACSSTCQAARCGDGIVRTDLQEGAPGYEYCDDGNSDDDDDCDGYCGRGVIAVANGLDTTCVAQHHGEVWCWGKMTDDENLGPTLRPVRIQTPGRVVKLKSFHRTRFYGITNEGLVFQWTGAVPSQVNLGAHRVAQMRFLTFDPADERDDNHYICTRQGVILRTAVYSAAQVVEEIQGPDAEIVDCAVNAVEINGQWRVSYCWLTKQNELYCSGDNTWSQLGHESEQASAEPVRVSVDSVRSFSLRRIEGGLQACAVDVDGDLYCWGRTVGGQLSQPTRVTGVPKLGALEPAWRLDTGAWLTALSIDHQGQGTFESHPVIERPRLFTGSYSTACVIDGTFRLWCKGDDRYGTAGFGKPWHYLPVRVDGLAPVSSVAPGATHACARQADDGDVYCWGGQVRRELTANLRSSDLGVMNGDAPTWVGESNGLASGPPFSCLIGIDQSIRCWGGPFNRLSVFAGGVDWEPSALAVGGWSGASGSGAGHVCVLAGGSAHCFGANSHGQSGQGNIGSNYNVSPVAGVSGVVALSLGERHSCALSDQAEVWCWGDNRNGQLGIEGLDVGWVPTRVDFPNDIEPLRQIVQVSAGASHTCVRTQAGTVHCWGGEGNPTGHPEQLDADFEVIQPRNAAFAPVPGIEDAIGLSSGNNFACAVLGQSAEVVCWAGAPNIVTGRRSFEGVQPRTIPNLPPIRRVEAGDNFACAVSVAGETWCWGDNTYNQLGDDYPGLGVCQECGADYLPVDRLDQQWSDRE